MMNRSLALLSMVGFLSSVTVYAAGKPCTYTLDRQTVEVGWTAFKTTQKAAVKGTFKDVEIKGKTSGKNLAGLVKGLMVTVMPGSVNSGNPDRDKTLSEFFFAKLVKNPIHGKVTEINEAEKTLSLSLTFNGETKTVPMKYSRDDAGLFTATGTMNVLEFKGDAALDSLHSKCVDLHKGPDGISKTWPDVEITLKGKIADSCGSK